MVSKLCWLLKWNSKFPMLNCISCKHKLPVNLSKTRDLVNSAFLKERGAGAGIQLCPAQLGCPNTVRTQTDVVGTHRATTHTCPRHNGGNGKIISITLQEGHTLMAPRCFWVPVRMWILAPDLQNKGSRSAIKWFSLPFRSSLNIPSLPNSTSGSSSTSVLKRGGTPAFEFLSATKQKQTASY